MTPDRFREDCDPEPDYERIDAAYDARLELAERNARWRRREERPELAPELDIDLPLFR